MSELSFPNAADISREQSRSGLLSSLRAIWQNMFTLPASIRTICFIQFFANLGWYPVLFWTSLWVSDIYKKRTPQGDLPPEVWEADAVRAGSRALFLQSLISLCMSAGAPFLVAESGIRSSYEPAPYSALSRDDGRDTPPTSAQWKREAEELGRLTLIERTAATVAATIKGVRSGALWAVPIKGLTLIKLWTAAQCVFATCMLLTWVTSTVGGAYFVIATTGISWSLAQWAPYALLGELVLVDPSNERDPRALRNASAEVVFAADTEPTPSSSVVHSRSHSRNPSHETLHNDSPHPLSRLVIPGSSPPPRAEELDETAELDTTVILRHSGDSDDHSDHVVSPGSPTPCDAPSTADKAGLILGIHNVFIVLPQFIITAVSAVIFHIMEPAATADTEKTARSTAAAGDGPSSPDAVGLVFRIGGTAAAVGAYLSYRLAQRWRRGEA